jgi:hypothetical protein
MIRHHREKVNKGPAMSGIKRYIAACAGVTLALATMMTMPVSAKPSKITSVVYDAFSGPDYDLADYDAKWDNGFGLGEMGVSDTRAFNGDTFSLDATPFQTAVDFSVFDHIKYIATSTTPFPMPTKGALTFSAEIDAKTEGTNPAGRVISGVYGPPGCADDPECAAGATPWQATALEGQQAGATLHMVDFETGQLFDWFVSGSTAFALVERLPASVIGSPAAGTRETMYTQIVKEVPITTGPHTVAIRFFREPGSSYVDFLLDGKRVARAQRIGVPLDVQGVKYTGIYPSLGPGEELADQIDALFMAHGLFSLLDAFPFQHPDAPELSVSISIAERKFGQGVRANFDDFIVTTDTR